MPQHLIGAKTIHANNILFRRVPWESGYISQFYIAFVSWVWICDALVQVEFLWQAYRNGGRRTSSSKNNTYQTSSSLQ